MSVEELQRQTRRNWALVGGLLGLAVLIDVVRAVDGGAANKRRHKR